MLEQLSIKDFRSIYSIMEQSFPKDEYRTKAKQKQLFNESAYNIFGEKKDGELLSFITVWTFNDFYYVEHFAVAPDYRNLGLGSKMLKEVKEKFNGLLVLEVECPTDELTKRRVEFYKRNGYKLNEYDYVQPSMAKGRKEIPLKIMSNPIELSESLFEKIKDTLYIKVYKVKKG